MRENFQDETPIPLSGEVTEGSEVVSLTPNQKKLQQNMQGTNTIPENPKVNISEYQKKLLEALQEHPPVVALLNKIFMEYPVLIIKEYSQSRPTTTQRQRRASIETTKQRLQLEANIEEEVALLSGINLQKLAESCTEESEPPMTSEEVTEAIVAEKKIEEVEQVIASDAKKKVAKKKTKKKSKKKTTKKKTQKK